MSENEKEETKESPAVETPTFVTPLNSLESQIGTHVMAALGHPNTVAVVTMVTGSNTGQQIVSMPLDSEDMGQVHALLAQVDASEEPHREKCVGFHCSYPEGSDEETN